MNRFLSLLSLILALGVSPARSNFDITTGSGTHVFAIDAANQGSSLCAATATECPATVLIDKTGTPAVILPPGAASENNSTPVVVSHTEITADPCSLLKKTTLAFSSTAAEFVIVPPVAITQVYICHITVAMTASVSLSLVGGLAPNCTTGTPLAIAGSTTAANGMDIPPFAPGDGAATIYSTTTSGHGVCILQSGTTKIAGTVSFVQI